MSGLDEFLTMFEEDPDFDSGDDSDTDPFERLLKTDSSSTKTSQPVESGSSSKDFQKIFGSPVQIQNSKITRTLQSSTSEERKIQSKLSTVKAAESPSIFRSGNSSNSTVSSSSTYVPSCSLIVDPFSKLRLVRSSVQLYHDETQTLENSLRERNITIPYVKLSEVFKPRSEKSSFWTCGVLIRQAQSQRKSAKGHDYCVWELSDLDSDQIITLFLFGTTATSDGIKRILPGFLLDLINPSILSDGQKSSEKVASSSSSGSSFQCKLSINNTNQIEVIGKSEDFGYCGVQRYKDKKPCTNPVNKLTCPVCIHHASGELRKLKKEKNKTKGMSKWAKKNFTDYEKTQFAARMQGNGNNQKLLELQKISGCNSVNSKNVSKSSTGVGTGNLNGGRRTLPRMELQSPAISSEQFSASQGNHPSIRFQDETRESASVLKVIPKEDKVKTPLVIDLNKTRHLTERDRMLLEKLDSGKSCQRKDVELPTMLLEPNAGSRHFLQYLSNVHNKEGEGKNDAKLTSSSTASASSIPKGGPLVMNRETLKNMQKALNYVRKIGPIEKSDPNKISKKRKSCPVPAGSVDSDSSIHVPGRSSDEIEASASSNDFRRKRVSLSLEGSNNKGGNTVDSESEEFNRILNAKSVHADFAEAQQQDDYFTKLERKESVENKLLSTFSVNTTAVMCKICKYIALSQSDFCKGSQHPIRAVKAIKRFFKCKDCGNRTMSLDRLPKKPCKNCNGNHWLYAPVGIEKAGPTLDSERLAIRGDEEKFLGSNSSKLFL